VEKRNEFEREFKILVPFSYKTKKPPQAEVESDKRGGLILLRFICFAQQVERRDRFFVLRLGLTDEFGSSVRPWLSL
jgi:hypothetical protein